MGLFFIIFFLLVNVIAGHLIMLGFIPNTAVYFVIFIIPLLFKFGVRHDRFIISLLFLFLYILLIGLYKDSGFSAIFVYSKHVAYPFLSYYIVKYTVDSNNYQKILKLCVIIGVLQLPIVIAQYLFYDYLIRFSVVQISHVDFVTGTFWIKSDSCLVYFLLSMIIYYLFNQNVYLKIAQKIAIICTFTAIIMISNSDVLKFALVVVFTVFFNMYYVNKNIQFNKIVSMNLIILTVIIIVFFTDAGSLIIQRVDDLHNKQITSGTMQRFYEGKYSRIAAIQDILYNPIKLVGDGLNVYFNPYILKYYRGVHGHFFLYYYELGFLGLIISYYVIWCNFRIYSKKIDIYGLLILFSFLLLTTTLRPLEQISLMTTFNLFLRINYLSKLKHS